MLTKRKGEIPRFGMRAPASVTFCHEDKKYCFYARLLHMLVPAFFLGIARGTKSWSCIAPPSRRRTNLERLLDRGHCLILSFEIVHSMALVTKTRNLSSTRFIVLASRMLSAPSNQANPSEFGRFFLLDDSCPTYAFVRFFFLGLGVPEALRVDAKPQVEATN